MQNYFVLELPASLVCKYICTLLNTNMIGAPSTTTQVQSTTSASTAGADFLLQSAGPFHLVLVGVPVCEIVLTSSTAQREACLLAGLGADERFEANIADEKPNAGL